MPKRIRLTRGTDILDARGMGAIPADADPATYVFHALHGTGSVDPALRGKAVTLPDSVADELLTLPFATFEEVTPEQEARDRYHLTLVRDLFGVTRDPLTGEAVDRDAPVDAAPAPPTSQAAPPPSTPATPAVSPVSPGTAPAATDKPVV